MTAALKGLSGFAAGISLNAVPNAVIERAKLQILDTLTTAVAAVRTPPGKIVAHALDPIDTGGPAHIVATGVQVSVNTAALVNTQMSVALDLASNLFFSQGLGGLVVFGPLALAESGGASGAELVQAVIAGYEVAGRVALSFRPQYRIEGDKVLDVPPASLGTRWAALGAAAANARLRKLNAERTAHALALTIASIPPLPGTRWGKSDVIPMAKYGLFGNMAAAALAGTLLAERGFTGDLQILDDAEGFHSTLGSECADPAAMTRDYGERWLITEAGFKRYPSGTHNQQALHLLQQLLRKHHIDPDSIRSIHVGRAIATSNAFANAAPANDVAAQFSLPYAMAAIALDLPPREWHASVKNERLRTLAARVKLAADAETVKDYAACSSESRRSPWSLRSKVRIETAQGSFEGWSDYGNVSALEIEDKFRHHCEGTLDDRQIEQIVETTSRLEQVPDIRQLTACFVRPDAPASGASR